MANRKKLIEEIIASFHAMRNKMQAKVIQSGHSGYITHSQLFVLAIIEQRHNIGLKEISRIFNISSSAATQLVDGLVDNGYVVRKENPKDRRALQLNISTMGRKRITELKNKHIKTISTLLDVLNDEELETYLKLHKKILSKINI